MKRHAWLTIFIALAGIGLLFSALAASGYFTFLAKSVSTLPIGRMAAGPFIYSFNSAGVLHEAPNPDRSSSEYWWLDSGGLLILEEGIGKTIHGALPARDRWRLAYRRSSPLDTDDGYRPQNLFRLVTQERWGDVMIETAFRIDADNHSPSPNRNESNGLLLMSRYQDGDTLYYAGLRVDGHAVIKKKYRGTYYTLDEQPIFPGDYSRENAPNLLPHGVWLHVRSEVVTEEDGSVSLRLFLRQGEATEWTEVASALDDGSYGGTPPITAAGRAGIRTDFMDVSFDSFRAEEL